MTWSRKRTPQLDARGGLGPGLAGGIGRWHGGCPRRPGVFVGNLRPTVSLLVQFGMEQAFPFFVNPTIFIFMSFQMASLVSFCIVQGLIDMASSDIVRLRLESLCFPWPRMAQVSV